MVQIVPWRITDIEAGPTWDAIYGVETQHRDEGQLPTFTPVRDSSILADGLDATHAQVSQASGGRPQTNLYGQLHPTRSVPAGEPLWVRVTLRWSVIAGAAAPHLALATYRSDGYASDTPVGNGGTQYLEAGWMSSTPGRTSADGVLTQTWTIPLGPWGDYAEQSDDPDLYAYAENRGYLTGWTGPFDLFKRGNPSTVWLAWLGGESRPYTGPHAVRLHDFLLEVAYPGELPLRQVQRDDHLAPGGTIRASTGTSRQGSIRARGYE